MYQGLQKVRTVQRKNFPSFVIELNFMDMNIYSFYRTFQNFIIFYCGVVCMVYVMFIRRLKIFLNRQRKKILRQEHVLKKRMKKRCHLTTQNNAPS